MQRPHLFSLSTDAARALDADKRLRTARLLFRAPVAAEAPVRPSSRNHKNQIRAGLLLKQIECGVGLSLRWDDDRLGEENDPGRYFEGAAFVLASGEALRGDEIDAYLRRLVDLINKGEEARLFPEVTGFTVTDDGEGTMTVEHEGRRWDVKLKLALTQEQRDKLAALLIMFAPQGGSCSLQADAHCAGSIFVGMVVTCDGKRFTVSLVSADIGCGMTMVPVVDQRGNHMKAAACPEERAAFNQQAMVKARRALKRGGCAENGEAVHSARLIWQALRYFEGAGGAAAVPRFLDDMRASLEELGLLPQFKPRASGEDSQFEGLTAEQVDVLLYVCGFAGTLGSSGNHFLELSVDKHGSMWWVAHSGSRALGAMVYKQVLGLSAALGTPGVATGELSRVYARAYNALAQFASLNRALCALLVSDAMGLETDGEKLRASLRDSEVFAPAFEACASDAGTTAELAEATSRMARGLTHNGIAAFYNGDAHEVMFVIMKGAIALGPVHCGLVACKVGAGCVMFASAVRSNVKEVSVAEAFELMAEGAAVVTDLDRFEGITLAGHGAGRKQSATVTFKQFSLDDLAAYCKERGVTVNLGPNVPGDHPDGYKDTEKIKKLLPLERAAASSDLKTLMSFKENIDHRIAWIEAFATYVRKTFAAHRETPDHAAWAQCDWVLAGRVLSKSEFADYREADRVTHGLIGEAYALAYAEHL